MSLAVPRRGGGAVGGAVGGAASGRDSLRARASRRVRLDERTGVAGFGYGCCLFWLGIAGVFGCSEWSPMIQRGGIAAAPSGSAFTTPGRAAGAPRRAWAFIQPWAGAKPPPLERSALRSVIRRGAAPGAAASDSPSCGASLSLRFTAIPSRGCLGGGEAAAFAGSGACVSSRARVVVGPWATPWR